MGKRAIFVRYGTGHVGEDWAEVFEVESNSTDDFIEQCCEEVTFDWCSSFGRDTVEDQEDAWWDWEDYSPEKHDMYRGGGGSFEEDLS